MAGTKFSALPAVASVLATDEFAVNESLVSKKATIQQVRQYIGEGLSDASTASVAGGFSVDTYLAGSAITIPVAGGWRQGTILRWVFDMVKTAAGVAALAITVRMGTTGTTGDAAVYVFTFGAGTAAVDTGDFAVDILFRSVGSGTAAVVAGKARCAHHLASTGLISTGASGTGILVPGPSGGFDSTTQTVIGLSVNGGAAFSGTNTFVTTDADNI